MALRFIEPFKDHLQDACLGSVSEIFDGNEPLIPEAVLHRPGVWQRYSEPMLRT